MPSLSRNHAPHQMAVTGILISSDVAMGLNIAASVHHGNDPDAVTVGTALLLRDFINRANK